MMKINFYLILMSSALSFSQKMFVAEYIYTDFASFTHRAHLYTDNIEAGFRIDDFRPNGETTNSNGEIYIIENDQLGEFFLYRNNISYYRFQRYREQVFYVDDLTNKLNWEINYKISKKIGNYNCNQAKIVLNGRNYTVWFTTEVPVKFGPLKLHGLPGLVVEVTEESGFLKMTLESFKKTNEVTDIFNIRKFFDQQKFIPDYKAYCDDIIKIEVRDRNRGLTWNKENAVEGITSYISDKYTYDLYIDLPAGLEDKLKVLH